MKHMFKIISLILISSLFFVVNAQNKTLEVTRVTPYGNTTSVSDYQSIRVTFSEQMVELQTVKEIKEKYFSFNIDVDGVYRWVDTKTLMFTPDKPLPDATAIKVTVKSDIKALSGNTLKYRNYTFTFNTIRPDLRRVRPYHNESGVFTKQPIYVGFNMPMSIRSVQDKLTVEENGKRVRYKIRYMNSKDHGQYYATYVRGRSPSEDKKNEIYYDTFVITPSRDFETGATIRVHLDAGIKALSGDLGSSVEYDYRFTTHKEFFYTGAENQSVNADFNPDSPDIEFSTEVPQKEFYENIEISPKAQMPDMDDIGNYSTRYYNLRAINFNPETTYKITLKKDMEDEYGQKLGRDLTITLNIGSYAPNFNIPTGAGVIEAYEGRKIPLSVINPNPITLKSRHLVKSEIIPFLILSRVVYTQNRDTARYQAYLNQYKHLLTYDEEDIVRPNVATNKFEIVALELNKYLGETQYGLLSLRLESLTGYENRYEREREAYIQVTDMGVTGKFSAESNTIFVTDLKTGRGVAGADVEIRDDYNTVLARATTDKEGIAETEGWYTLNITKQNRWETPRQWVMVTKGKDIAYIHSQWGTGVDPWRMDVRYDYYQDYPQLSGSMSTERGLYKPGENIHIKGVVRENIEGGWNVPRLEKDVSYVIKDSRNKEISKGDTTLNEYGTFLIDTKTAKDAPTGYYSVRAEIGDVDMSLSFRVEEFKALEFETLIWAEDKEYVLGESIPIRMSARYLFGEPMANKPLTYSIRINENYYTPPNNSGYRFTPLRWYEDDYYPDYNETLARGTGALDAKGEYMQTPHAVAMRDIHSAMLNIEATVEGEDSQKVSARKSILIHGADFYFGLRRSGYFVEKDKPVIIDVVAVKPNGERISGRRGTITVKRQYWESVRKAVSGGRFQWFSEQVTETIATEQIRTKDDPIEFTFTPNKTGLYIVSIHGIDPLKNQVKSEEYMYVVGDGYAPWAMHDDDLVELVVERENYKPNETASIMIQSPYQEATAFVTVEREFVIDRFVTNVRGSSPIINVPIKNEYLPNVYVGVALIKGRVEDKSYTNHATDLGKPSFKIGYASLNVSPVEKSLIVKINKSHAQREPGEKMAIDINVTKQDGNPIKSEIMVTVADIGVLNLIGFRTPNWFNYFYGARPLGVSTSDTRLHLIGQRNYGEKGENVGGGGDDVLMRSSADMMKEALGMDVFSFRKNFLSTAFYTGRLTTDARGRARVEFNLPDNITSFRIMASAVDDSGYFGAGEDIVVVKKNIMLMQTLPEFLVIEDEFSAGATLYNYSGGDLDITVIATGENIEIENPKRVVTVKGGSFEDVRFNFTASRAGEATIRIAAKGGKFTDGIEKKIEVQVPRISEAVALYGSTIEDEVVNKILIPTTEEVYQDSGDITAYLSPSAFSEMTSGIDYLIKYPYGCLEQKMSKIYPIVASKRLIVDMKLTEYTEEYLDSLVYSVLKDVMDYQSSNGGFSYWENKAWVSPWLTSYATFVLLQAKKNGYDVNEAVLEKALSYLAENAKGRYGKNPISSAEYVRNSELAYIANVLAMGGKKNTTLINNVYKNRESLPFYGLLNLLQAMHYAKSSKANIENVRQLILNSLKEDATTARYDVSDEYKDMVYLHSSTVRDTALALAALIETGYRGDINDKIIRYLTQNRKGGRYNNTQDNVTVFYAMNEYFKAYESVNPNYRAEFIIEGKRLLRETFRDRTDESVTKSFPLGDFDFGEQTDMVINRRGKGRLYYGVRMTYAPKGVLPAKDNGIKVEKTFMTMDGRVVQNDKFEQGKDYKVMIKVNMPFERNFVIVDDAVPAGFRVLNATFDTESSEVKAATGSTSSSRYWWYGSFNHVENYNDKVILYGDVIRRGEHTYTYVVRAVTPGEYTLVNTKAEEMYNPDVFGYSSQDKILISPK